MRAPFVPAWWCRGPHLQTLWSNRIRRKPHVRLLRERIELPDGDFIDLDWAHSPRASVARGLLEDHGVDSPIVMLVHGLEGSSRSTYARGLLRAIGGHGWRGVVMHFRGCSGEPNRLVRSYHSGETGDLAYLVNLLRAREPRTPMAIVGVSLGGNVLLKWLGEIGARAPIQAAAAVSVPFLLAEAADRLAQGFSRVYQWQLLRCLRASVAAKSARTDLPLAVKDLSRLKCFRDFDEHVTAPLHGFVGADDYYAKASSRSFLKHIRVPTLLLQARDDPFMTAAVIPSAVELSNSTELEVYDHGGHVGFVMGTWPWRARFFVEERLPAFLQPYLAIDPSDKNHF